MTVSHPDQLIAAFLEEGPSLLPDQTFDAIRGDIHRTRQRAVVGLWRQPEPRLLNIAAIAAAVVLAVGLAAFSAGSQRTGVGAGATPSERVVPSLTPARDPGAALIPSPWPNQADVLLQPGRYRISASPHTLPTGISMTVTVGTGWTTFSDGGATKGGLGFGAWQMIGTFVDPCTDHRLREPPPGPGVDDLVARLTDQPGTTATTPRSVTVDGFPGKTFDLTVTRPLADCGGDDQFWLWASPENDRRYVQNTGETNRISVVDVGGRRVTFFARIHPRATPTQIADVEAVLASIELEVDSREQTPPPRPLGSAGE